MFLFSTGIALTRQFLVLFLCGVDLREWLGRPHLDFLESLHRRVKLLPAIDHALQLIHTVPIDNHFATFLLVPQIAQSLSLELGKLMVMIFLQKVC